jgi:hypothetical protein
MHTATILHENRILPSELLGETGREEYLLVAATTRRVFAAARTVANVVASAALKNKRATSLRSLCTICARLGKST